MDQLAFDLLLYVHEPDASAILVRIEQRTDEKASPMVEDGLLKCQVEEVIHGKLSRASTISVPYTRMKERVARAKSSFNHWNALLLEVGDLLLLVGKPMPGGVWKAMSGNQVSSSTDSVVQGLRECYRIQRDEKGSRDQRAALRTGMVAANPLTRRYSLEAISKHEVVSREDGCAMIVDVLKKETPDRDSLLRMADALSSVPFFDEDKQVDDVNRAVVVNMAIIIERLTKPEDKATCVRYLASCVLSRFSPDATRDGKVRSALLGAIAQSPPGAVGETLAAMKQSPSADDKVIAEELTSAWSGVK